MTFEHEDNSQKSGTKFYTSPTLAYIQECVEKMDLTNRSFFILTGEDGSYVQCAGARRKLMIEYRKISKNGYNHYVLGLDKEDKSECYVNYSSGCIPLQKNEIMTIDHVLEIFEQFYQTNAIPADFLLREIEI